MARGRYVSLGLGMYRLCGDEHYILGERLPWLPEVLGEYILAALGGILSVSPAPPSPSQKIAKGIIY